MLFLHSETHTLLLQNKMPDELEFNYLEADGKRGKGDGEIVVGVEGCCCAAIRDSSTP